MPRDELGDDPLAVTYGICARLPLNTWERQRLLEDATVAHRLERLLAILRRERALLLKAGAGGAGIEHPGLDFLAN